MHKHTIIRVIDASSMYFIILFFGVVIGYFLNIIMTSNTLEDTKLFATSSNTVIETKDDKVIITIREIKYEELAK